MMLNLLQYDAVLSCCLLWYQSFSVFCIRGRRLIDNLILSLSVIAPTFILIIVGYLIKRTRFVAPSFWGMANKLAFHIFFPCMLFTNIYDTDISQVFNGKLIAYVIGAVMLIYLTSCLLVPRIIKNKQQQGVIIQGIYRSNYLIFGVSIVTNMYGSERAAVASMLASILIPLFNVLAVIALTIFTGEQRRLDVKGIFRSILTNPLILACVAGLLVALFKLPVPDIIIKPVTDLGKVGTPLALLVLGGEFDFAKLKGRLRVGLTTVITKIVLIPAVFVPIAVALGFRNEDLLTVMLVFATPVAVSSYVMAQQAKADHQLAGQLIVLSCCGCILSIFLFIFILRQMMLI